MKPQQLMSISTAMTHWILLFCISVPTISHAQDTTSASAEASITSSYRLGSGDTIEIVVWAGQQKEESLSGEYFVLSSGTIEMPLLGTYPVSGKTLEDATADLQQILAIKYIRNPHVTMRVQDYGSQMIHVLGAVEKPGTFAMKGEMSLAEALANAQGTDARMKGDKQVKISRVNGEKIVVDLERMLRDGTANIPLQAGDVIYVTEGQYVVVNGMVEKPGNIPWKKGITVTEAISAAGGASASANIREIFILRGDERIPVYLKKISQGRLPDVVLEQGDKLFVEESVF